MQEKQQRPTAIFSVCAPSDIQGLERWEAHLRPLEQAGTVSIWSVRHLQPGTDRQKLLHDHLDQADLIILLLSADFFIDDECEALMEHALAHHQQRKAKVIPLQLRPVAWRETKLAAFTPWPSNGPSITQWSDPEMAIDSCVRELRRMLGRPVTKPLVEKPKRPSVEEQNRTRMLQRLRHNYEGMFAQSLEGVAQIELSIASKPDAVQNAATLLFRTGTCPEQVLPPRTSILRVYDEAAHELLILGAPGAGKSTLLVELARQLVERAEADEMYPLPVLLPLSSWAVKRPPLEIWLAEQVALIYGIPKNIAEQWAKEQVLLPLLDGLDEMEEVARSSCIAAINAYHRDHMRLPLVICSRQAEYEEASRSQRLTLQNAVVIQPLTHEHVQAYLKQAGKPLSALRRVLATNSALAEIATTPLMVYVLSLTYQGKSARQLSTQHTQLEQEIWGNYLARMGERKGNPTRYPLDLTRSWLGWLARQMRTHNQTIFYLEHLQPDWLDARQSRIYEWLGVRLPAIMIGVLVSVLVVWWFSPIVWWFKSTDLSSPEWILTVTIGGLLGGLLFPMVPSNTTGEAPKMGRQWGTALSISLGVGLVLGWSFGWDTSAELRVQLFDGGIYGGMFSISIFLMLFLLPVPPLPSSPALCLGSRRWAFLNSFFQQLHLKQALLTVFLIGLSVTLGRGLTLATRNMFSLSLSQWFGQALLPWLSIGLDFALPFGLASVLIGVILRRLHGEIRLTERATWTWQKLRSSLLAPAYLRIMLPFILCVTSIFTLGDALFPLGIPAKGEILAYCTNTGISQHCTKILLGGVDVGTDIPGGSLDGLSYGAGNGLSHGLSFGLLCWLLIGLYQSIAQERIEDQDRRVFNQGTRWSLQNSLSLGLISGIVIGVMGIVISGLTGLSDGLIHGPDIGLNIGLVEGLKEGLNHFWFLFIASSVLFGMIIGGLAVWQHYLIRFLLRYTDTFPLNVSQFLNDAKARILLRRVGGGYSFVHRLLLDYLADLSIGPASASTTHLPASGHSSSTHEPSA